MLSFHLFLNAFFTFFLLALISKRYYIILYPKIWKTLTWNEYWHINLQNLKNHHVATMHCVETYCYFYSFLNSYLWFHRLEMLSSKQLFFTEFIFYFKILLIIFIIIHMFISNSYSILTVLLSPLFFICLICPQLELFFSDSFFIKLEWFSKAYRCGYQKCLFSFLTYEGYLWGQNYKIRVLYSYKYVNKILLS